MVRLHDRLKTVVSVPKGSTPCATHHFPAGSLHAPYDLLSLLALRQFTIKAGKRKAATTRQRRVPSPHSTCNP